MKNKMEDVLKEAGSCGHYQVFHVIFTQLPRFVAVWVLFFMIFGGYDPGWRCIDRSTLGKNEFINGGHTAMDDLIYEQSEKENGSFKMVTLLNNTYNLQDMSNVAPIQTIYNGTCTDSHLGVNTSQCKFIEFNTDSRTLVSEFSLVCERAYIVKIIILVQGMGYALGPLVAGQIGDRFGRKIGLYGCTLIIGIASGVSIFSTHWVMFAVCCFFNEACINSIIALSPLFGMELLNSKWRGYYNSFPTSNLALCSFTLCSYLLKDWRYLHVITCVISLVSCIGYFLLPESPRWLLMNSHPNKAKSAIGKIAKLNKKPPQTNNDNFLQLYEQMKEEKANNYTIVDVFRHKDLVVIILKLGLGFLIISAALHGTSFGIKSLPGQFYLNAILAACIELVVVLLSGPMCHILGRRLAGLVIGLFGLVACVMIIISLTSFQEGLARIWVTNVFTCLARALWESASGVGVTFAAELLPTVVRSVAIGLIRFIAGIGALLAPVIMPSKDTSSLVISFSVVGVCYCLIAGLFLSFQETKGFALKDGFVEKLDVEKNLNLDVEVEDGLACNSKDNEYN